MCICYLNIALLNRVKVIVKLQQHHTSMSAFMKEVLYIALTSVLGSLNEKLVLSVLYLPLLC